MRMVRRPTRADACREGASRILYKKPLDFLVAHSIEIVRNGNFTGQETQTPHLAFIGRINGRRFDKRPACLGNQRRLPWAVCSTSPERCVLASWILTFFMPAPAPI